MWGTKTHSRAANIRGAEAMAQAMAEASSELLVEFAACVIGLWGQGRPVSRRTVRKPAAALHRVWGSAGAECVWRFRCLGTDRPALCLGLMAHCSGARNGVTPNTALHAGDEQWKG